MSHERFSIEDQKVLTIKQWCALNGFCYRHGRNILAGDDGPVVTRISERRIGISRRNNREWQNRRAERRGIT